MLLHLAVVGKAEQNVGKPSEIFVSRFMTHSYKTLCLPCQVVSGLDYEWCGLVACQISLIDDTLCFLVG